MYKGGPICIHEMLYVNRRSYIYVNRICYYYVNRRSYNIIFSYTKNLTY